MKMNPWLFHTVLANLAKTFAGNSNELDRAQQWLLGRRTPESKAGRPGSGILHGRQNIAKTLTFRATYVPGGFNVARNRLRDLRKQYVI